MNQSQQHRTAGVAVLEFVVVFWAAGRMAVPGAGFEVGRVVSGIEVVLRVDHFGGYEGG